ncbi:uncharacterized protein METZ01_LOCUS67292 [marine metagenome]|uniref:Uncharacterized protein n=1 Tax=marine metagenome TaxID=408172 RepID=A0A381TFX3_9ZZZZ
MPFLMLFATLSAVFYRIIHSYEIEF